MPNHIHGIITILDVGASGARPGVRGLARRSLGSFIAGFKSAATRRINELRNTEGSVWQRNYHDHIIRDEEECARIREYIEDNPRRWAEDEYNPA